MTYVTYSLKWIDGSGHSPAQTVVDCGAEFDGGRPGSPLLAVLTGTSGQCAAAIAACADWSMVEVTKAQAVTLTAAAYQITEAEVLFRGLIPPRTWEMGWMSDGNRIVGNGVDSVTMEIRAAGGDTTASVDVAVDGTTQAVTMTDGIGQLEISSSSPPGVISIVGSGVLAGKTLSLHVAQGE